MMGDGLPPAPGRVKALVRSLLVSPLLPVYLAALVIALGLPSLEKGATGDDYIHRVWLLGQGHYPQLDPALFRLRAAVDVHVTLDGDPRSNARLMDLGVLPWWTAPDLRIAPLRPLGSLPHWLDYRLWPDSTPLMHAQSLLWTALSVAAAALLYRGILGPSSLAVAGLAACLFAFDSTRGNASYVVAYRNGVVALFFCVLTLIAHWRLRHQSWKPGRILAPALLAATLLTAEVGVATAAYLFAYALVLDRGTLRERARTLLPYLAVGLVWQLLYVGLGNGVRASGEYLNPLGEPTRFLDAFIVRGPSYVLGLWTDLDLAVLLLGAGRKLALAGFVTAVVIGALLAPLLRRDATARFWALGTLLCLLPISALRLDGRRLLFASLGFSALIAQLVVEARRATGARPRWRRAALVLACLALVSSRLLLGPLLLFAKAWPTPAVGRTPILDVPLDYTVERQTLVVLNPPTSLVMLALPFVQAVEGRAVPLRLRGLAASRASGTATRTDDYTLVVRVKGGYLSELDDALFREPRLRFRPGDRIVLEGLAVEVLSVKEDGRPWEVRFRFDVPLEHPSLRWRQWRGGGYEPFRPPNVGGEVTFTPAGIELPSRGS